MSKSDIRTANFKFRLDSEKVGWIYASLMNQPQVELYKGPFPHPFNWLNYVAQRSQDQLLLATDLGLTDEFVDRYGHTVGSVEDLQPLLRRYGRHQFINDGRGVVLYRDDQVQGMIARMEDHIIIQEGGQSGKLSLSDQNPVNDLQIHLANFSLLPQRYVSAIWNASPETDQMRLQLVLDVPALPEGAPQTYFSTFEIIGEQFRERPRPVSLDEDIGGYRYAKEVMKALLLDLTQPDDSRRQGTQPYSNKFVLLTGEEGTGKSLFPKAFDKMLRDKFGNKYEHFRLKMISLLTQYGPASSAIVSTILDHIRENEKRGVPTLLHLDNLEQLLPSHLRFRNRNLLAESHGGIGYQVLQPPSSAEFNFFLQVVNPIITELTTFGRELGAQSRYVVALGESRVPREELPESIARTFRRTVSLDMPSNADLVDILRAQIRTTRSFAERSTAEESKYDPFVPDIGSQLDAIAQDAVGLNGRDIQQALLNITTRRKAATLDRVAYSPITADELREELIKHLAERGIKNQSKPRMGFHLPR